MPATSRLVRTLPAWGKFLVLVLAFLLPVAIFELLLVALGVPTVLERENAVGHLRKFIGDTDSTQAAEGTIRRAFGTDVQCNAVHASDSPDNAAKEIGFFFSAKGP